METVYFNREDVVLGNVPVEVAHYAMSNAPCQTTGPDGQPTLYKATEHCAGAAHPDHPAHPFKQLPRHLVENAPAPSTREEWEWVDVPRKARIAYALLSEEERHLMAKGLSKAEALEVIAERHADDAPYATSEDAA